MVIAPTAAAPRTASAARSVIRVFVAEDHHITLWGLSRLIDGAAPRLQLVGTARSRSELLNHDAAAQADVILLDLDLGGDDSVAVLSVLRQRCPGRVLVLTGAGDIAQHRDAVLQGARGVVHKSEPAETILRAIDKVHEGEVWLNRALLGQVLGQLTESEPAAAPRPADPEAKRIASLTPRERQTVAEISKDAAASGKLIAQRLNISENTLRNHLSSIYTKLGISSRLELFAFAKLHGDSSSA